MGGAASVDWVNNNPVTVSSPLRSGQSESGQWFFAADGSCNHRDHCRIAVDGKSGVRCSGLSGLVFIPFAADGEICDCIPGCWRPTAASSPPKVTVIYRAGDRPTTVSRPPRSEVTAEQTDQLSVGGRSVSDPSPFKKDDHRPGRQESGHRLNALPMGQVIAERADESSVAFLLWLKDSTLIDVMARTGASWAWSLYPFQFLRHSRGEARPRARSRTWGTAPRWKRLLRSYVKLRRP